MEVQTKQPGTREQDSFEFANRFGDSDDTQTRLSAVLAANLQIQREKELYPTEQERFAASIMKSPISTERAYSYFGAMLGLFPPFAMFSKFLFDSHYKLDPKNIEFSVIFVLLLMNVLCTVAGYFSGKLVGKIVTNIEKMSWSKMLILLPFIGILWGIITGSAGGVIVFIIGAFFGAFIASIVGGIAIPAFTIFHRMLKKGDMMEEKHFFPIALGITCIITAYILGL